MIRGVIIAAAAVVCFAFAQPVQARIAQSGLNHLSTPNLVEEVQYRRRYDRRRHYRSHRGYRHHSRRHRHCWNQRVRVRVAGGHFVWRTTRRCAWR
ncbi:MAG: hypothetical protein Q8M26_06310 [Pseudolabrys sp.]|nr:hypothetical protein [Pseudolabrys sp.]